MNKNLLLFSVLFFLFGQIFGQGEGLSISPRDVDQTFTEDLADENLDLELYTTVSNISTTQTLMLRWERVVVNTPLSWKTQVCDNNLCYDSNVSTNFMEGFEAPVFIEPDTSFELIFHVLPNQEEGVGQFKLYFSDIESPDVIIDSVTYSVAVTDISTSLDPQAEIESLKLFPNPAFDYFQLPENEIVDEIIIYSILGKKLKTFSTRFNRPGQYDISDLHNGIYLVSLINYEQGVLRTTRLSKRDFRP